ncbi:hypothetical protein GWI33_017413 [Rhynchophorus ferrugineus]|uniref:Uncharacterized protein n=1 Tax=Rhynchophorus ferrugineus TaxID=354439 RepID=A0A834IPG7_RHYFE|nr:hypothetical protein GWI33_017413 [Rhynchophorus ferrugineus]
MYVCHFSGHQLISRLGNFEFAPSDLISARKIDLYPAHPLLVLPVAQQVAVNTRVTGYKLKRELESEHSARVAEQPTLLSRSDRQHNKHVAATSNDDASSVPAAIWPPAHLPAFT